MADDPTQFANQAQEATRTMVEAMQALAGMQSNILQQLSEIQQGLFKQGAEAANEQLQLLSRVREPREFASAQAELVKRHGQLYADQVKKTTDVIAEAWQEYGQRLEKSANTITDKAPSATTSKKSS
jgi:cob(I)alamin adenosyltransferase